jgi:heterodisulfide reductase subunit B
MYIFYGLLAVCHRRIERKTYGNSGYGIPVLTYEEMAGLVPGMDLWELGMQLHQVSVESLFDKMRIKYGISKKFTGYLNENIGIPDMPEHLRI